MRSQKYYFFFRMEEILPEKLFEADDADDECYGIDFRVCEFEGIVLRVIGNDENVFLVRSGLDALDNCPLRRVEDVGFIPLEE